MTPEQVQTILGQPSSIDQSETDDKTIQGEVYHYPTSNGDARVTFVNNAVFHAEFVPGAKS